jgi:hypothetical protein
VIAVPMVLLLLRERPSSQAHATASQGSTLREAIARRRFWQCGAGFVLIGGPLAAVIVHLAPMLTDGGMTPAHAARLTGLLGVAIIAGRVCLGAASDRFHAPYVGFAFLLLPVGGCLLLAHGIAVPGIISLGLAAGAEVDLLAYLCARYWGLKAYGQIYGWQLAAFSLAAGLAPIAMGVAQDRLGSYGPGLYVCAAAILAGALLIASLGRFEDVAA